jgi:hypothetical protein
MFASITPAITITVLGPRRKDTTRKDGSQKENGEP